MAAIRKGKRTSTRQWLAKACPPKSNTLRPVLHEIHTDTRVKPYPVSVAADWYRLFVDYAPDVLPGVYHTDAAGTVYNAYHVHEKREVEPGHFPAWETIPPRTPPGTPRAVVVVKELEQAVRQVRVIAKHNFDAVRLSWDHHELTVSAKAVELGDTAVTLGLPFSAINGGDVTINGKFLLDALSGMKHIDGWARIYSPAPDVPILIHPGADTMTGGPDREAVIMPMRPN